MDLVKWENVIVEWVNCLNLCKPIKTIEALKNEEFFEKLLEILLSNQKVLCDKKSQSNISLIEFLKKHYPAYCLKVEPALNKDTTEIINICSLLLHYCCLIDGRDELISPLCKELSSTSQISLKSFLDEIQYTTEITRHILNDIITNIHKNLTSTQFQESSFDSPKQSNCTPLREFLKTPLKKQQIYDLHKREIKSLQSQLDLERFEKADLQEELNLQYEKNQKLDKTISDKQIEINKLRTELLSLESRTPTCYSKTEGRIENKYLRDEIKSLEKYIENLHKEQEEIQNERDKARAKLKRIEEQSNVWQEKTLQAERLNSKLSEETHLQKEELLFLREKCEELSSILQEINSRGVCDESCEIDISTDFIHNKSGPIDYDNLAHTVVDVQLMEAQEENKNLIQKLEISNNELSSLNEKLKQKNKDFDDLLSEKEQLNNVLNKLNHDFECCLINFEAQIKDHLEQDFTNYDQISKFKNFLQILEDKTAKNAKNFANQISTLQEKVTQLNNNELCYKKDITNLKTCLEENEMKLKLFEVKIEDLNKEKSNLSNNLTTIQNELSNENNSKKLLEKEFQKLEDELSKKVDYISSLEKQKTDLECQITCLKIEISTEINNKTKFEEKYEKLQNIIINIEEQMTVLQNDKISLSQQLEDINQIMTNKSKELKEKTTKITNLQNKNSKLHEQVTSLKNEIINEINIKEKLDNKCKNLQELINEKDIRIKDLETEKVNIEKQIEILQNNIILTEKDTSTKIHEQFLQNQQLSEKIHILNENFNAINAEILAIFCILNIDNDDNSDVVINGNESTEKLNYLKNNICNLISANKKLQQENANNEESYRKKISEVQNILSKTQISLEELTTRRSSEVDNYEKRIKDIEEQNNTLKEQLNQSKLTESDLTSNLISIKTELKQTILNYKAALESQEAIKQEYESSAVELNKKLNKMTETFSEFKKSHAETKQKLENSICELSKHKAFRKELEKLLAELKLENSFLEDKIHEITSERDNLRTENNRLTTELKQEENIIKSMKENENVLIKMQDELHANLSKLELELKTKIQEFNSAKQDWETEKSHLDEFHLTTIEDMNEKIKKLKLEHTEELERCKSEIELLSKTLEKSATKITELQTQNVELNKKLNKMTETLSEFQKSHAETKQELENSICELTKLKAFCEELEKLFAELKLETDNLKTENNKLSNELRQEKSIIKSMKENENGLIKIQDELSANLSKLELELENKIQEFNTKKQDWEIEKSHLEEFHLTTFEDINKKHTEALEKCKSEIDFLSKTLEKSATKITELQTQNENLIQQIEILNSSKEMCLETLQNENSQLQQNISTLSEEKNILKSKLDQVFTELQILKSDNNENKIENEKQLQELKKEKENVIEEFEEKLKEKDKLYIDAEKQVNDLNRKLLESVQELENINIQSDKKIEELKMEKGKELELKKQFENALTTEKSRVEFLEIQISDISNTKNNLIILCSESYNNIHNLYKIVCENNQDTEIAEQIVKLKQEKNALESLRKEKEIVDKECISISNEIVTIKDKCTTLQKKNSLLTTYESEKNTLKTKIFDLETKLSNLQLENVKYQKQISDNEVDYNNKKGRYEEELLLKNATYKQEISNLRTAYSNILAENSRLQLDCTVLTKTIEDRNTQLSNLTLIKDSYEKLLEDNNKINTQLSNLTLIKDSYEKLLEENNKINMEVDTLRYKRTRDKEEFKSVMEECNIKAEAKMQEIRTEYEDKLKKMKDKIVKLYREEIEKEKSRVATKQQDYEKAQETIKQLKSQLWVTGDKYVNLKKELESLQGKICRKDQLEVARISRDDFRGSRESISSMKERSLNQNVDERRISTLPRDSKMPSGSQIDIIEESITFSRKRRSVSSLPKNIDQGLKMEDEEGEIFNNTYLADLKAGRCVSSDRDSISSTSSRISELKFRNSLCPPHLKSSYPAETQFASPGQGKEEDIKLGSVDLDDSMSSSLLPGEKPRSKKDWGQTLYKKPGPPTPSKNGGKLSLQGSELPHPREVLRENRNTSTPNRFKNLFSRSSSRTDTTENSSTPRESKRRSIFRR